MPLTPTHICSLRSGIVTGSILVIVAGITGCSGSSDSSGSGGGGSKTLGGAAATGGNASTGTSVGGNPATGGALGTSSAAGGAMTGGTSNASTTAGTGGVTSTGGSVSAGGNKATGGALATGGTKSGGGAPSTGGTPSGGGTSATSATGGAGTGGTSSTTGVKSTGGASATGGAKATGGAPATGGSKATGGAVGTGGSGGCNSGPIGTFTGALATGITFMDTDGKPVNAHGGGIIKVGSTYYMHGEYFLSTTTDNNFNGFSMYSSQDLATWKNEGLILPQQASGLLGPNRKGERPHIIKCPSTGEFVLYAHAADVTYQADKEVVYATSATVNGQYSFKGSLTNASGTIAAHSDMSALSDGNNAYVVTESGHVYTLASDCHSWVSDNSYGAVNGDSGGSESPTVFKAGSTYYWIGSYKTGWRANNNFYSTAPAMTGPWTFQGFIAPVTDTSTAAGDPNPPEWISDQRTWLSQSTWVQPVVGCQGTTYVFWGDHWYGTTDTTNPGKHNDQATYVFQPLIFNGTKISMPTYLSPWKLDVGLGTWSQ